MERSKIPMKRGQVTIFIVLGLLIIVFVALFLSFVVFDRGNITESIQKSTHTTVEQCLENVVIEAIPFLSLRGGYYNTPEEFVTFSSEYDPVILVFPYYYKDRQNFIPSKEILEKEFEELILAETESCSLDMLGITLSQSREPTAEVLLGEEAIIITYDTGLAVIEPESVAQVEEVTFTIKSNYYEVFKAAAALAEIQKNTRFCISCLSNYEDSENIHGVFVEEYSFLENYVIIYGINYTEPSINNDELIFYFANRYEYEDEEALQDIYITPIEDQTIQMGYQYEYHAEAAGDIVFFTDNTELFDIGLTTGEISFYPEEEGLHLIKITATNAYGKQDSALFYLNITHIGEPPLIEYIGYQTAGVNEQFIYDVDAISENTIYFTDDTELFDIDINTGEIEFTPTKAGEHTVTITAITDKGVSAAEEMILVIY